MEQAYDEEARAAMRDVIRNVALSSFVSNLLGAVVIFVFLQWLSPQLDGGSAVVDAGDLRITAVVFVVYLLVSIGGGTAAIVRYARRWVAWLVLDEAPTEHEHLRTLQLPAFAAASFLVAWLLAAVVFGVLQLALGNPAVEMVRVGLGIVFAGLVTSGLGFAVVERAFRPAITAALRGREEAVSSRGLGIRARLGISWALGSALPLLSLAIAAVTLDAAWNVRLPILSLAVIGLVTGGILTRATARAVAVPIGRVVAALERVRGGDLEVRVEVDDGGDVGLLQVGLNRMVDATRERARVQELFGRHVGEAVARRAVAEDEPKSVSTTASVLFADVVGSTGLARVLPPSEVVDRLNAFFQCVVEATDAQGGLVNKFAGDGALCVFGPPDGVSDHADRALAAARHLRELLAERLGPTGLTASIGVSTGLVVAGDVGAADRFEYTVIGDPVNEASRLTELAKQRTGRTLASGAAVLAAGRDESARWEPAGRAELRGRGTPTDLWCPVGFARRPDRPNRRRFTRR